MMKKFAIIIVAAAFAVACGVAFAACGSDEAADETNEAAQSETEATGSTEAITGGWEVVAEPVQAALPGDVQTAFDTFMKNYDDELIPMAYYGKQITAGTNYGLLCKSKNDGQLQTVVLKEDPELGIDALINQFIIANYTEGGGADFDGEPEDGAWEVPYDVTGSTLPEEAQAAYDKARNAFEGTAPQPLAFLGTQVVSGMNYAFLAKGSSDTDNPVTVIQVVTVYEDLEGNAEITNIHTLDMAEFGE